MDAKQKHLNDFLTARQILRPIAEKMSASSYATPNYSYQAMRIGNSIGDYLDIGLTLLLAESIAKHYHLTLYTVEHCEFHSRGTSEKDLQDLTNAALAFEEIRQGEEYKKSEKQARETFIKNLKAMIH